MYQVLPWATVKFRMIIFSLLVHQRPPAERQPFWDHYKLQNVLHSGTTPSFCYSSNRLLVSHKHLTNQLCVSDDEVRAVLSFRAESLCIPRCIRPDVTCCCLWMLRCWCVTRTLSLWVLKVCFVKWAQPSVAIKTTISCQGPSLLWENSCVRQQGSHQMGSARSKAASTCILFLSVQEKKRKHWQTEVNSKLK